MTKSVIDWLKHGYSSELGAIYKAQLMSMLEGNYSICLGLLFGVSYEEEISVQNIMT